MELANELLRRAQTPKRLPRRHCLRVCCPGCGGKLRVIACIEDPQLIRKILGHVHKRDELTVIEARGPPGRGEETLQLM